LETLTELSLFLADPLPSFFTPLHVIAPLRLPFFIRRKCCLKCAS
jgi:hypothetical protein